MVINSSSTSNRNFFVSCLLLLPSVASTSTFHPCFFLLSGPFTCPNSLCTDAVQALQVIFLEQSENPCPTIFSHCRILYQRGASASVSSLFAVVRFVLIQNIFLHFLRQLLPTFIHFFLTRESPLNHFSVIFLPVSSLGLFFISSVDHPLSFFFSSVTLVFHLGTLVHVLPIQIPFA